MTVTHQAPCRECTTLFKRYRASSTFCSAACRRIWNNRRAMRGAELYDLFRAMRNERAIAAEIGLWKDICRLEKTWTEEDDRERPDRRSYIPPQEAVRWLIDHGRISRQMTASAILEDTARRRKTNAAKQRAIKPISGEVAA